MSFIFIAFLCLDKYYASLVLKVLTYIAEPYSYCIHLTSEKIRKIISGPFIVCGANSIHKPVWLGSPLI